MTQKLKSIQNENSKQRAHFTTFCIREQKKNQNYEEFSDVFHSPIAQMKKQENKQLLLGYTNSGLSRVTNSSFSWTS